MYVTDTDEYVRYVNRKFANWEKVKKLTRECILERLKERGIVYDFPTEPYTHQLACFAIGVTQDDFLFFADMGLGKTKVVCDIYGYRKSVGQAKGMLVIVPFVVNLEGWRREIEKHAPYAKYSIIEGSREFHEAFRRGGYDIYVVTRQTFLYAMTSATKVRSARGTSTRRSVRKDVLADVRRNVNMLVIDEIDQIRNPHSKTFRVLKELASCMKYRYGLTGTPMGRSPYDVWAQYRLIDGGRTFWSLRDFERHFFIRKPNPFGGVTFIFRKQRMPDFVRMMGNRSIRYRADECADLPDVVRIPIRFVLPRDIVDEMKRIASEMVETKKVSVIQNAFVRLRQLASGFMTFKEGEEGRIKVDFSSNPRLEVLESLIEEIPHDRKIVIFHEYIHSGNLISEMLERMEIPHVRFYSGTSDKSKALSEFLDDPEVRVAVANSVSAATGLNLQVANYEIFYETPTSPRTRMQAEARCIRQGQTRSVFIYDLIAANSIDVHIYRSLEEGKDLFEDIVNRKVFLREVVDA